MQRYNFNITPHTRKVQNSGIDTLLLLVCKLYYLQSLICMNKQNNQFLNFKITTFVKQDK